MQSSPNFNKCLSKLKLIIRVFGVWYPEKKNIYYYIYSTAYLFICPGLTNIFMLIYLLKLNALKDLTYGLYMFLTQLCGLVKFIWFLVKIRNFRLLVNRSKTFQLESKFEEELVEQRFHFFIKLAGLYCSLAMIAVHTMELTAIFADTVELPFSSWFPFVDWEHNQKDYWIAVGYQYISVASSCLLLITIDVLFSFLLFVVSIEIELIGLRMSKIGCSFNKDHDTESSFQLKQLNILKDNVILHREAIEFKCSLEDSFTLPFFVQFIASAIVISSIITELSQVSR